MLVDYLAMTWYPIEYLKVSGSSDLADFNSKEYAKSIISNFNWKPWGERLLQRSAPRLDYYQINRHKKEKRSNRFSFFIRCSENGHFLNTLLFLLRLLKSFTFIVHKPVIYSMFIYTSFGSVK